MHSEKKSEMDFLCLKIKQAQKLLDANKKQKMDNQKKEVEEYKKEIKSAIATIRNATASDIKDGLRGGCDILFFDSGRDFKFGIDSCYRLQVFNMCGNVKNKSDVIEKLKMQLENCM